MDKERFPVNDSPIVMSPYRVMAEMFELQPLLNPATKKLLQFNIRKVTKGSPAYAANIRAGNILVEIQGIKVRGLTEQEFRERAASAGLPDGKISLVVSDPRAPKEERFRKVVLQVRELSAKK